MKEQLEEQPKTPLEEPLPVPAEWPQAEALFRV